MNKKIRPKKKSKIETCYCGECISYKELSNLCVTMMKRMKENDSLMEQNRIALLAALKVMQGLTQQREINMEEWVKELVKHMNKAWNEVDKEVN